MDFFDQFAKIPISQKLLLLLLIMAAIFFGFFMFLFTPLDEEIVGLEQEEAALSAQETELEEKRRQEQALTEEVAQLENDQALIGDLFPTDDNYSELIRILDRTATDVDTSGQGTQLVLNDVRREPYIQEANYTRMPVQLRMEATYDQVVEFCWVLAREQSRIIHVRALSLRPALGVSIPGPPVLSVELAIETFFRAQG